MKARLSDNSFLETDIIYRATPTKDTPAHYGGKMHFLADGTLLVTTGDGFEYREGAQDTFGHFDPEPVPQAGREEEARQAHADCYARYRANYNDQVALVTEFGEAQVPA